MISIALASYNGEKYISEQIDSILSQTIQDFELIVCDDCSKDSTWSILEEYKAKDKRIKIYKNEHNLGFKKNFERAISLCSGDYIAFSDQDDIWMPEHLELLLNHLNGCDLVCGNAMLADIDGNSMNVTCRDTDKIDSIPVEKDDAFFTMLYRPYVQGSTSLAKTDFLKKYLPIPYEVKFHDQWFGMMASLSNGVSYVSECILKYRMHGNNETEHTKWNSINKIKEVFLGEGNRPLYIEQLNFLNSLKKYGIPENKQNELNNAIKVYKDFTGRKPYKSLIFWLKNYFKIYRSKNIIFFLIRFFRIFILFR